MAERRARRPPLIIGSGTCNYARPEYNNYYRFSHAHTVILYNNEGQPESDLGFGCMFPGQLHSLIDAPLLMQIDGNVYLNGAKPSRLGQHTAVESDFDPRLQLVTKRGSLYSEMDFEKKWFGTAPRQQVSSVLLGKAVIPDLPNELPDGSPLCIDTDYFGKIRSRSTPTPGPFENPGVAVLDLKVW